MKLLDDAAAMGIGPGARGGGATEGVGAGAMAKGGGKEIPLGGLELLLLLLPGSVSMFIFDDIR